jgi:hypothetical protein
MTILLIILTGLAAAGLVGSVRELARDGYRRIPDRLS